MSLFIEVLSYTATDPASADKTLKELSQISQGKLIKSYRGFTEEQPDLCLAINFWASAPPTTSSTSQLDICHPAFDVPEEVQKVASAKVVEFVFVAVKATEDPAKCIGVLIEKLRDDKNTTGATWGPTDKEQRKYVGIIGWDSSKAHFDTVGQPDFVPLIDIFKTAADGVVMFHAALSEVNLA